MRFYRGSRWFYWGDCWLAKAIREYYGVRHEEGVSTKLLHETYKDVAPVAHWITEEGLPLLQDFIYFPKDVVDSVYYALKARFKEKTYCMDSGFDKWAYHDIPKVVLHANFEHFRRFVEQEAAHMYVICTDGTSLRGDLAGLAWLDMQAEHNPEMLVLKKLYTWWKYTYPARPDPYVDLYPRLSEIDFEAPFTEQEVDRYEKIRQVEDSYKAEDDAMLSELVILRHFIWT